jgi:small subunit ribosomal protein S2
LSFLAVDADGALAAMLKTEASAICRQMAHMHRGFEAMLKVNDLPDALFAVDVNYEDIAIMQANCLHIPIIAVVDTNSDPTHITRMIFVNNGSTKSRQLFWKQLWRRFKLDRQPTMRTK